MNLTPSLLLALAPLALTGCFEKACTLIDAPSGVEITFQGAEALPAGAYVVEIDGVPCAVDLPLAEDSGAVGWVGCNPEGSHSWVELTLTDDGAGLASAYLGNGAPDPLDISITRDGEEVHAESVAPDYAVDEPNGEGCGERYLADVTVDLG